MEATWQIFLKKCKDKELERRIGELSALLNLDLRVTETSRFYETDPLLIVKAATPLSSTNFHEGVVEILEAASRVYDFWEITYNQEKFEGNCAPEWHDIPDLGVIGFQLKRQEESLNNLMPALITYLHTTYGFTLGVEYAIASKDGIHRLLAAKADVHKIEAAANNHGIVFAIAFSY